MSEIAHFRPPFSRRQNLPCFLSVKIPFLLILFFILSNNNIFAIGDATIKKEVVKNDSTLASNKPEEPISISLDDNEDNNCANYLATNNTSCTIAVWCLMTDGTWVDEGTVAPYSNKWIYNANSTATAYAYIGSNAVASVRFTGCGTYYLTANSGCGGSGTGSNCANYLATNNTSCTIALWCLMTDGTWVNEGSVAPYSNKWIYNANSTATAYAYIGSNAVASVRFTGCGTYYLTANTGCTSTCNIPTPQLSVVQPTCSQTTGSVTVTNLPSGYYTKLNNGSWTTQATYTNLAAGSYSIVVSLDGICTASSTFTINSSSSVPTPQLSVVQPTCSQTTGSVTVTNLPSGYYTRLNNGSWTTQATYTNLAAGSYSIVVSLDGICTASSTFTLNSSSSVPTPQLSITQPSCSQLTGSIAITNLPSGYYSKLDNGSQLTGQTSYTNIASGTHTLTIGNGSCTASTTFTINSVSSVPTPQLSITQPTCSQSTGSIVITNLPSGYYSQLDNGSLLVGRTSYTNIASGTHTLTIGNGSCTASTTFTINSVSSTPTPQLSITQPSCSQSTGSIVITNLPSGYYSKLDNGSQLTGQTSYTNIAAGTHTLTIGNGSCTASTTFTINSVSSAPTPQLSITQPTCSQSTGSIVITNLPSGYYSKLDNGSQLTGQTSYTNIASGTHTLTIGNGSCTASTTFTINSVSSVPTPQLSITQPTCSQSTGSIVITNLPSGYYSKLDNGSQLTGQTSYTNIASGTHTLTIGNGSCTASTTFTINSAVTPTITFTNCPNNISLTATTVGGCMVATWQAPTASSNCGTPSVTSNYNSGFCFPIGTTTVTYTASLNGITKTCSFKVTVNAPALGSIGDFVFCDNNNNRVYDSGDTPISGVTVTLCNSSNVVLATTTTNTSGNYSFGSLAAGTYIVKFPATLADGKNITTTNPLTVILSAGQNYVDADAGYYKATSTSSIKDVFVFCDNNNNKSYDFGDTPIQGVTVTLCNSSNQVIATAITDASGGYSFLNLAAGTYIVKFPATLADGKNITTQNPITITLTAGQTSNAADAGYYKPATALGSIGELVFCDNNNNGVYESGDTPISGVTVTLCNSSNVAIATTTTNTSGNYSFGSLAAGTYIVKFPATLSDGKNITTTNPIYVTLAAGDNFVSANAGYYKAATIDCNAVRTNSISKSCANNLPVLTGTALAGYEYMWLSSTTACPSNSTQTIPNATNQDYTLPSVVTQTTYFMRCARPIGCTTWGSITESNCITVTPTDCSAPTGGCDAITVTGNTNGTISITGLGTYTSTVQIFTSQWQPISNQTYTQSSVSMALKNGTYIVKVQLYNVTNGWQFVCEKQVNATVSGGLNALSKNVILDINAVAEAQRAQIQWVNNTGSQNDFFIVEKRNNVSGSFEKIETVNSKPTESNEVYTVYDNAITEGDNTYRIQLTMLDGQVKTSAVKTLIYKNVNDIRIYPNPASDFIEVDLKQYEGKKVTLSIYNQVGKLVHTQQIERASATPTYLNLDKQTSGQMLLRVTAEGYREVTKKFVIQN